MLTGHEADNHSDFEVLREEMCMRADVYAEVVHVSKQADEVGTTFLSTPRVSHPKLFRWQVLPSSHTIVAANYVCVW